MIRTTPLHDVSCQRTNVSVLVTFHPQRYYTICLILFDARDTSVWRAARATGGPSEHTGHPVPAPHWLARLCGQLGIRSRCMGGRRLSRLPFQLLTPLPIAPSPPWRNLPPLSSLPLSLFLFLSSLHLTSLLTPPPPPPFFHPPMLIRPP